MPESHPQAEMAFAEVFPALEIKALDMLLLVVFPQIVMWPLQMMTR
jgi:hypothetical protein